MQIAEVVFGAAGQRPPAGHWVTVHTEVAIAPAAFADVLGTVECRVGRKSAVDGHPNPLPASVAVGAVPPAAAAALPGQLEPAAAAGLAAGVVCELQLLDC